MSNKTEAQRVYEQGYAAFEEGDFLRAGALAERCLALSPPASYWHAGALGLQCWVATFNGDEISLVMTAAALLGMDTGGDKPWFDGVANLNLGLGGWRKAGRTDAAQELFRRAAKRYAAQKLHPGQPEEWQHVLDYFTALCRWAADGDAQVWRGILEQLGEGGEEPSELVGQLSAATGVMQRYAEGERVQEEAVALVEGGVSRTFLCLPLLFEGQASG